VDDGAAASLNRISHPGHMNEPTPAEAAAGAASGSLGRLGEARGLSARAKADDALGDGGLGTSHSPQTGWLMKVVRRTAAVVET